MAWLDALQGDRGEVGAQAVAGQANRDGHGLPGGDGFEFVLDGFDWRAAPTTAAAWWRPSANAPRHTSRIPTRPARKVSLPQEPRNDWHRTGNADGTIETEPSTWSRTGASSKESPPASLEHLLAMTAAIWHSRATGQPVAVPRLQWGWELLPFE
jgi:hypothetical protein